MSARAIRIEDLEKRAWDADFKPGALASLCGLEVRQLQRDFRKDFKTTPTDWLRRLRCRLAVERLTKGYSTKATATELKFGGPSGLCHDFQKVYGVSPQSFAPGRRNVANGQ